MFITVPTTENEIVMININHIALITNKMKACTVQLINENVLEIRESMNDLSILISEAKKVTYAV